MSVSDTQYPDEPICLEVIFHIKEGHTGQFLQELQAVIELVVIEPQCLDFCVFQDPENLNRVRVTETWTSRKFLEEVQMKKHYYVPYFTKVEPMWSHPLQMQFWRPRSAFRRVTA